MALIGGARLTNESAYAWAKLAKGIIGTDSVDAQLGDGLPAEVVLGLPRASIDEACAAPVLVTLAGDLREEVPVLFLRLREAVVSGATALVEISPVPTALSALAAATLRIRPGDAPLMAKALTGDETATTALGTHHQGAAFTRDTLEAARRLLSEHPDGEGVVIVAGRPSYAESGEVAAAALRTLASGAAQGNLPAGAAPGQRVRGARHGAGAGDPARPGQPRCGPRPLHRCLGRGPGRRRPVGGGHLGLHGGRAHRRRPGACPRAVGRRPAQRLPRPRRRGEGALGGALRGRRDRPSVRVGRRACRRRPALRSGPRTAGDHDQPRGQGEPPRPQDHGTGVRVAGLDDRHRARRRARHRPGRDQRERPGRRGGAHRAGLRRVEPGDAAPPRRPRRGRRPPHRRRRPRGGADRPDGAARDRVGGTPGRAAPRRHRQQHARPRAHLRRWARRRPCSRGPVPAAPSPSTSPRPTTTRCAWWRSAASTTPAAP